MSFGAFDRTLVCNRRRSAGLSAGVVIAHAAIAVTGFCFLSPLAAWSLAGAAGVSALWEWRRLGHIVLYRDRSGEWHRGSLQAPVLSLGRATWSSPWLVVLSLHGADGTLRVPLARDALDAITWRRLRAYLRLHGPGPADPVRAA